MDFQTGIVVNYNNQNYVIVEVINKNISEGKLIFLKLKNLINQEILIVESNNVKLIDLNKRQTTNDEIKIKGDDTSYIESLFDNIGYQSEENNLDSFDIFEEPTFTLDNIELNNQQKTKKIENEHISHLIESFQTSENTQIFEPRRKYNNKQINQTFTDLDKIAEKQQTQIFEEPIQKEETSVLNLEKDIESQEDNQEFNDQTLQFNNEIVKQNNLEQNQNVVLENKKNTNTIEYYETLENNITSNLEKDAINNIGIKAKFAKEKHYNTLEIGPINAKKLLDDLENEPKEEIKKSSENNTNTIFNISNDISQEFLKKSNKYKKFKIATGFLILIFVLWLLLPIMTLSTKIAYNAVVSETGKINVEEVFTIYLFKENSLLIYKICDVFLIFVFPILTLVFLVYLVSYIISINVKQYKKIAYYNLEVRKKLEIIEDMQDYNNETSIYLIKVHNDIKKIKKDIKRLENQKVTTNLDNNIENIKKISH